MKSLFILALSFCVFSNTALAGKLYKWVDANGNISYQDQPPPKNAKVLREASVDSDGRLGEKEEDAKPVLVYTVANCDSCKTLLSRLVEYGVPVEERNLENDREAQQRILEQSSSLVAPSLLINNQIYSNPSEQNLKTALTTAGYKLAPPQPPKLRNRLLLEDSSEDNPEDNSESEEEGGERDASELTE